LLHYRILGNPARRGWPRASVGEAGVNAWGGLLHLPRPSGIEGGVPGPLVARETALGPHPEAPKAFRKRPNPRGASLATVRAMCDWRPRQVIAGNRAAAATKDL